MVDPAMILVTLGPVVFFGCSDTQRGSSDMHVSLTLR